MYSKSTIVFFKRLIHSKKFHHQQVYEFKYHTLKTNFSKRFFPLLKEYILSIHQVPYFIPESAFKAGPRCSQLRIDLKPQKTTKHNNAPRLAEFALTLAKTNRERHKTINGNQLCPKGIRRVHSIPEGVHEMAWPLSG